VSRSTQSSGVSGSISTECRSPLTRKLITIKPLHQTNLSDCAQSSGHGAPAAAQACTAATNSG
jgi:hypothetical protein